MRKDSIFLRKTLTLRIQYYKSNNTSIAWENTAPIMHKTLCCILVYLWHPVLSLVMSKCQLSCTVWNFFHKQNIKSVYSCFANLFGCIHVQMCYGNYKVSLEHANIHKVMSNVIAIRLQSWCSSYVSNIELQRTHFCCWCNHSNSGFFLPSPIHIFPPANLVFKLSRQWGWKLIVLN